MLIENTQSNHRQVGTIYLGPGINQVDSKKWNEVLKAGYKSSVNKLIEAGILVMRDDNKITIAVVGNTYDVPTLRSWLKEAKGPLKGAIKKQISTIIGDEEERKEA